MITIIKEYQGKTGTVTVEKYEEGLIPEYHVKHSNPLIPKDHWYRDRSQAIAVAQFLTRY